MIPVSPSSKDCAQKNGSHLHVPVKVVLCGTFLTVLAVSVISLVRPDNFRGAIVPSGSSHSSSQADIQQLKNQQAIQELYIRMVSSMMNDPNGTAISSSLMSLMQQIMASSQGGSKTSQDNQALDQLMSSFQALQQHQSQSSLASDYYQQAINQLLQRLQQSQSSVSSAQSKNNSSSVSVISSSSASLMTPEQQQALLMELLFLIMKMNQQSSVSSSPASSVSSPGSVVPVSSSAPAVSPASNTSVPVSSPEKMTYDGFVSSVESVTRTLNVLDPAKTAAEKQAIRTMPLTNAGLGNRLLNEITPVSLQRDKIYTYITQELPVTPMSQVLADFTFTSFKIENGRALVAQKYVTNPDIDPKDWFAPAVAYIQYLGLMKGQGDGLFAPTKTLNQAELAVILANAVARQGGTKSYAAAGQVFSGWPVWAQTAIADLRGRGVNVTFFTSSPTSSVTRLQAARAIGDTLLKGLKPDVLKAKSFSDTIKLPIAVQNYVSLVSSYGIMTGKTGGLFDPYGYLTRAEAAKIFGKAMDVKQM